jgi:hypothetical protein
MAGPFTLTVNNEQGQPLNGVIVTSGEYNTSPCPSWPNTGNCTTGPGGPWEGTTDSSGQIVTDAAYTCQGQWSGTLKASGYDDYPYTYKSGAITGPFYDTIQMVASSDSVGATSNPQNKGYDTNAGNLSDQLTAGATGTGLKLDTELSNFFGGETDGIPNWVVLLIAGIAVVGGVALLMHTNKGG